MFTGLVVEERAIEGAIRRSLSTLVEEYIAETVDYGEEVVGEWAANINNPDYWVDDFTRYLQVLRIAKRYRVVGKSLGRGSYQS